MTTQFRPAVIRALQALDAHPQKRLRPFELARAARVTPQGYSRLVDAMEDQLLIVRDQDDGRFCWQLTFKGMRSVHKAA